ncbi:TolC family protein [Coraliomargarita sinensis]|nr:TolC family protein [Coraliomargarita sinensis]
MYYFQKSIQVLFILLLPLGSLPAKAANETGDDALTFTQALQRAMTADPRLELNTILAEASDGQVEQAKLRPNPVIGTEVENFLGTGPLRGVQGLEVTLGVSQVIETAEKRRRRTELAAAERSLVDWEREMLVARIETSVRSAFIDVLLAQQMLGLREEQLDLAKRSAAETARLVDAARSPKVEQTRAELSVRRQAFAKQQAEREYAAAKSVLASFWTDSAPRDFVVAGEVALDSATPEFSQLAAKLSNTAAVARYSAVEESRKAALDLERARATPDVEIFAGGRYFNEEEGEAAFLVGVEVPWPVFDKNQGNIHTARAKLRAVGLERQATHRELMMALNRAYQQRISAQAEADAIQSELLAAAEATLRDTEEGYERGQFQQLAVLDSRSALFEVREAYLEALRRYAAAQAEIEALTRPAKL